MEAAGLGRLGASVSRLGEQMLQIKTAEDVAEGTAQYNEIVNRYNESLKDRQPETYEQGFLDLKGDIENITKDKVGGARRNLQNKFRVWNEINRASLVTLGVRNKVAQVKNEMPQRMRSFAAVGDKEGFNEYLNGLGFALGEGDKEAWLEQFDLLKNKNDIFRSINIAADNPTNENIAAARAIIEELSVDEIDKFNNLNRLRTKQASVSSIRNETFQAVRNQQSSDMAESYNNGRIFDDQIVPELRQIKNLFDSRLTNGTLNTSDNITYESLSRDIDIGTRFFEPHALASAYATGMSTDEYLDLVKRNEENKRLTRSQRESLGKYDSYVNDRYANLTTSIKAKIPPNTLPEVMAAIDMDKGRLRKIILDRVKKGDPDVKIYKEIESAFLADTDSLYKNWLGKIFSWGVRDFTAEVTDIGDRQERYETILDLMKTGEAEDIEELGKLLEFWYK